MIEQNQLIDIVPQMEVPLRIDERLIHLNPRTVLLHSPQKKSFLSLSIPREKEGEVFILLQHFFRDQDNIIIGIIFNNRIIWNG